MWRICAMVLAGSLLGHTALAQGQYGTWDDDERIEKLVDELRGLVDEADRSRAADPRFLRDLRGLMRRYDRPWRRRLVSEDFRDGDYINNPTWTVAGGQFTVAWGGGLATLVKDTVAPAGTAAAPAGQDQKQGKVRAGDLAVAVLGQLLGGRRQGSQQSTASQNAPPPTPQIVPAEPAEIFLAQTITNAFAIAATVTARPLEQRGGLDLAVYQGPSRAAGYRLSITPGEGVVLYRHTSRGAAIVETASKAIVLDDGQDHAIGWTRTPDGEMAVILDGEALLTTVDRGFRDSFDGLSIINRGGDFMLRALTIDGTG